MGNKSGKETRGKKHRRPAAQPSSTSRNLWSHYEDLPEEPDEARIPDAYLQRESAENTRVKNVVEYAGSDGILLGRSSSRASLAEETECKTPAYVEWDRDETRDRDETTGENESKPHRMLPEATDTELDTSLETKEKGSDDDDDDADQHDGDVGDYIKLPPTTQGLDRFAAGPPTACSGTLIDKKYLRAQMTWSTTEGDSRSADDCRLAKGVVMTTVLPHSGVSVAVGIRVLVGLDSEKLEARQKQAENDGYRKADVFEYNIYKNGGDLQVKLQNIEWMSTDATEKSVFNTAIEDMWSDMVSLNVFCIKSYDAVKPGFSLDSNFCAEVVVEQAGRHALTVGFMQDLHCCVDTAGNRRVLPYCRCHECVVVETNKKPPITAIPPQQRPTKRPARTTADPAADVAAKSPLHHRQQADEPLQQQRQSETTDSGSDMNACDLSLKSENDAKCPQDIRSVNSSDDGPKCAAWSYQA